MEPNQQGLEGVVETAKALPQQASFASVVRNVVTKRYGEPLVFLNKRRGREPTVFLISGRRLPGQPRHAVVKYLPYSPQGQRELAYIKKYAGWLGPSLYAFHQLPEGIEVVMEPADASLRQRLPLKEEKKHERQFAIASEIAHLVSFMEEEKIGHYDLKPENVLVYSSGDKVYRLTDFGLTRTHKEFRELQKKKRHHIGTYGYMPPEYFRFSGSSCSLTVPDIYAYGMLLYEIFCDDLPPKLCLFSDDIGRHFELMCTGEYRTILLENLSLHTVAPVFRQLIASCIEDSPLNRPASFREILSELQRYA